MEKGRRCSRKDELSKQGGGGPKGHGPFGETSVSAVAEQSAWELALGLQAVGALEPGETGPLDGALAASRGSADGEVRTPAEGQIILEGRQWPGWELFETPDPADSVSTHLGQR